MLSLRLNAIIDMVKDSDIVADIGCDHGLLSCELVKRKIVSRVYAMDINEKPLMQAKKTIDYYQLHDHVMMVLSDGLSAIGSDVDTIIIAGMGFDTCKKILEDSIDKIGQFKRIIVQINKNVDDLRQWISDRNYTIIDETVVCDGHYYQIIVFNVSYHQHYQMDEILFGPILMAKMSDTYQIFLKYYIDKHLKILDMISNQTQKAQLQMKIDYALNILNRTNKENING